MSDTNGRKRVKEKVGLKPMVYFWTFQLYEPFIIENWNRNTKVSFQSVIVSYFTAIGPLPSGMFVPIKPLCLLVSVCHIITRRKIQNPKNKSKWLKYVRWCQFISSIWPENQSFIKNSLLWWSTKDIISKACSCMLVDVNLYPQSDPSPCS